MATLRSGSYGSYYGSPFNSSEALNDEEMLINAKYIRTFLSKEGWTINSISALLGNLQAESTINPGRWQSEDVGNTSMGYGLVQWTPATKYFEWCTEQSFSDPSEMDNNLKRILYELKNNIQWIATISYNMSFEEFSKSNLPVSDLARAFLLNYERPADQSNDVQEYRSDLASSWYTYLKREEPSIPRLSFLKRKRRRYNLLFRANRRREEWIRKH